MEIVTVLVIVGVLAAVLYPAVAVQIRKGQTSAVADQLRNLREAIANYKANVQRYPRFLTQLTQQPAAGAPDVCSGGTLPAGLANAWRGPYLAQNVVGNMPVGDATVQNTILRNPVDNSVAAVGLLQIQVTDVDQAYATDLEAQFDGNSDFTTGTITWVASGSSGTLTFQVPIRNC